MRLLATVAVFCFSMLLTLGIYYLLNHLWDLSAFWDGYILGAGVAIANVQAREEWKNFD